MTTITLTHPGQLDAAACAMIDALWCEPSTPSACPTERTNAMAEAYGLQVCEIEDFTAYLHGHLPSYRAASIASRLVGSVLIHLTIQRVHGVYRKPKPGDDSTGGLIFHERHNPGKDTFPVTRVVWEDER